MSKPSEASGNADVNCEQEAEGCTGKWEGGIEFGYVAVSGNEDTASLNGQFNLSYELTKWKHEGFVATVTSSSEEKDSSGNVIKTESEKYVAQIKSNYKISNKSYAFGIYDYDSTKDSGFEYQMSLAVGAGYNFIKDDTHVLDGELGFGSRKSKTEATLVLPSETNNESITRIAGKYKWKVSETATFEQKLSSEIGDDNTISKSYTGLSAKVIEDLALKLSYAVKRQSEVPLGSKKTETITSFTVVYSF
ncbi:DUF481 domain-containing protein [Aliikangiella maris]|uniref:DUF481 domain-containing protein n=1 Tax=Aliikangiella maris TaxID=3162458 RepID=A0ABV2BP36_9GAMM